MRLSYHCETGKEFTIDEVKLTVNAPLYVPPPLRQINQGAAYRRGKGYAEKSTVEKKIELGQTESSIYMLQSIRVGVNENNIIFDSGCGDLVSKKSAVDRLGRDAKLEVPGPIILNGVGDVKTVSKHGIHKITLPLYNGSKALCVSP